MGDNERLGFLMALGQEFCDVIRPLVEPDIDVLPQTAFEVFSKVLGKDFDVESLRTLSQSQTEQLCRVASTQLESVISKTHLSEVVGRTLARW